MKKKRLWIIFSLTVTGCNSITTDQQAEDHDLQEINRHSLVLYEERQAALRRGVVNIELRRAQETAPSDEDSTIATDRISGDSHTASASASSEITPFLDLPSHTLAAPTSLLAVTLSAWLTAWQEQDLDGYFASYHELFVPTGHSTLLEWQESRRRNIAGRRGIHLEVFDLELISRTGHTAEVVFWLKYQSPTYSDETLKKLTLIQDGQRWLIHSETNLQVRRLE